MSGLLHPPNAGWVLRPPNAGWAWYCTRDGCDASGCGYLTGTDATRAARAHEMAHEARS